MYKIAVARTKYVGLFVGLYDDIVGHQVVCAVNKINKYFSNQNKNIFH